jgi:hypothetical protein
MSNERCSTRSTKIVRSTDQFRSAEAAGRLIKIPTGDGMALIFYNSPGAAVECALEYSFALIYLALGDKERAIDEMERAYRERAGNEIALIKVDPMLDDLRGNPRFKALIAKVFAPKK